MQTQRVKNEVIGARVNLIAFLKRWHLATWTVWARGALILVLGGVLSACTGLVGGDDRGLQPLSAQTVSALEYMGSSPGEPMMVRIYKQSAELEIWKRVADGSFKLFRTYGICTFSGELGPKIFEGDRQSPEGFYTVTRGLMNPRSQYYLAFNLGFPNKFDRAYGRTGSNIMVHGDCSSRGCYAMTDEQVAEIYALARESFLGGNRSFQVQVYPFRMTPQNLAVQYASPNLAYWQNLKTGYDHSEALGGPTSWDVCNKEYVFDVSAASGQPLDARAACPTLSRDQALQARVDARQSADQATFELAVASIRNQEVERQLLDQHQAQRAATLSRQTEVVNGMGDAIGGFFSGLFGGAQPSDTQAPGTPASVLPGDAPLPHPRPLGS